MDRSRISGGQFAVLLFVSRLSYALLLPTDSVIGLSVTDRLLSIVLGAVLLWLFILPTVMLLRRSSGNILDCGYRRSRLCGRVLSIAYAAVCLFILCVDVLQFCDFADRAMPQGFSVGMLTIALIAVAFVASFYGIQALARTALPLALFSVVCLCVFGAALLPEMRVLHFPPTASVGFGGIVTAAVRDLPRTAELITVGLLYPYVSGNRLRSTAVFSGGVAVFTALVTFTALGVLGDFAAHTAYPYYDTVKAAQVGVFERLDILVTAVWLGTFFVRATLFSLLFCNAVSRVFGKLSRRWAAVGAVVVLSLFALLVSGGRVSGQGLSFIYAFILGAACIAVPLLLKRRGCR